MISAVVFWNAHAGGERRSGLAVAMARSLASLIDAAVAGLIRDVTIAGPRGFELSVVAEEAGCACVEAEQDCHALRDAFMLAKTPAIFLLRAGYGPGADFLEDLCDYLDRPQTSAVLYRAQPEVWQERMLPVLAPIAAVIAPAKVWQAQAPSSFERRVGDLKGYVSRTKMCRIT